MRIANRQIGALIAHCVLFWGPDIVKTVKGVRKGESPDRHYIAMKKYKEANWWWYATILVIAFVLGIIVTAKEDIGIPVWAYIVALLLGAVIAPFVSPGDGPCAHLVEYDPLRAVRKRCRHQPTVQDDCWGGDPRPTSGQPLL